MKDRKQKVAFLDLSVERDNYTLTLFSAQRKLQTYSVQMDIKSVSVQVEGEYWRRIPLPMGIFGFIDNLREMYEFTSIQLATLQFVAILFFQDLHQIVER